MNMAAKARAVAFHAEAKLHGFRRTKEGVVVSFVLHPQEDGTRRLAIAELGCRFTLALVQMGDDEEPVQSTPQPHPAPSPRSLQGRERYATADEMDRAVTRAALLAKDPRFQEWIYRPLTPATVAEAAEEIRSRCGVSSRSEIGHNHKAYQAFLALETEFREDTGQIAELRQ